MLQKVGLGSVLEIIKHLKFQTVFLKLLTLFLNFFVRKFESDYFYEFRIEFLANKFQSFNLKGNKILSI